MVFSSEFKNQVISRILSKEISITDAHREYGIGKSTVYKWIKKINLTYPTRPIFVVRSPLR